MTSFQKLLNYAIQNYAVLLKHSIKQNEIYLVLV